MPARLSASCMHDACDNDVEAWTARLQNTGNSILICPRVAPT